MKKVVIHQLETVILGVIGDTHIPDRATALHPGLIPMLKANHVTHILHTGDICISDVLNELSEIAPVLAIRGNRDVIFGNTLEKKIELEIFGLKLALLHGHGDWGQYLRDKLEHILFGYKLERYINSIKAQVSNADIIIFGHTHDAINLKIGGTLFFNPGSACVSQNRKSLPTLGIMSIDKFGKITGGIISLIGYELRNRQWKVIT